MLGYSDPKRAKEAKYMRELYRLASNYTYDGEALTPRFYQLIRTAHDSLKISRKELEVWFNQLLPREEGPKFSMLERGDTYERLVKLPATWIEEAVKPIIDQ